MAKIAGAAQHTARLRKGITSGGLDFVSTALFEMGNRVQVDAQNSITEGAVSGAGHVPSAPGDAPNNDSGVLANNIETVQVEPLKVVVSSNAPYAAPLEFGTSRMSPRPYMAPALAKNRDRIAKRLAAAVNQANRMK